MQPVNLTVWSDYVCPWCYIGLTELDSLKTEFELRVDWRPFLLRPDAPEEGWALPDRIKQLIHEPQNPLALRAQRLGINVKHREHVPNSRRAHECTEFARAHGKLGLFHHHILERYWSRGEDLHDWSVLRAVAAESGLNADDMQHEVEAGAWQAAVESGLARASELEIHAVPTFLVENQFLIQGAQEAGVFRQAFERIARES